MIRCRVDSGRSSSVSIGWDAMSALRSFGLIAAKASAVIGDGVLITHHATPPGPTTATTASLEDRAGYLSEVTMHGPAFLVLS